MNFFPLRLLLPLGVITAALTLQSTTKTQAEPLIMGYYPSYRASLPPQNIRYDRFTHIIHSFVAVDAAGHAETEGNLPSRDLTTLAHAQNMKVLLGLGGGSNGALFSAMANDTAKRQTYIGEVLHLMTDNGYDGAVVDWEFPAESDKVATTAFVADLRTQMRALKPDSLLGMAVPAKRGICRGYDGPALKDNVDFIQVMTYDYHGPWNHAGYNAPLYPNTSDPTDGAKVSFDNSIDYWLTEQGFSKEKILVGVPSYGRGFVTSSWGPKPTAVSPHGEVTYADVRGLLKNGWTRQWDTESKVPWLLSPDSSERISYDDEISVAAKAKWTREKGLPGLFFWEISQDFIDGDNVLAAAAESAWNAKP